jgi:phosphoribosylformylglycinamidine (FGAM) synthase-like amidotransferase family enzyme
MKYEEIIEQFATALNNKQPWIGTINGFEASSESGMIFRWYETNGKVVSFFPKF